MPENTQIYLDPTGQDKSISMVPVDIVVTNQKPDMVIINNLGNVTLVELTVPFETNIIQAAERKSQRYEGLLTDLLTVTDTVRS